MTYHDLRVVAQRIADPSLPAPMPCSECESWKARCLELERALAASEAHARAMQKQPPAVRTLSVQTEVVEAAEEEVQIPQRDEPAITLDAGCQTHGTLCLRCQSGTPLISKNAASQVAGLIKTSNVAIGTKPEKLQPTQAAATQTLDKVLMRDMGCLVALEDEEHSRMRRELLTKIDKLLEEMHQLRLEAADAWQRNGELQTKLERGCYEEAFSTKKTHGKTNPTTPRTAANCRRGHALLDVWADANREPVDIYGSSSHVESSPSGVCAEHAARQEPLDSLEAQCMLRQIGGGSLLRTMGVVNGTMPPTSGPQAGTRSNGRGSGAATHMSSNGADACRKTVSAHAGRMVIRTPRSAREGMPADAIINRLNHDAGKLPRRPGAHQSI